MKRRTTSIDVQIGANLRRLRIAAGLSQEKLGDKLGISFQQIQKYEKGANRIGAGMVFALSEALPCSISEFYRDIVPCDETEPQSQTSLRIAAVANRLPGDMQQSLLAVAKAMESVQ